MRQSLLLLFLCIPIFTFAQLDLPKGLTDKEQGLLGTYQFPTPGLTEDFTAPPTMPVRSMAEWEELQALVVTWTSYKPVLADIIRYAREETEVIVVTNNIGNAQAELLNIYAMGNLDNITFVQAPFNSVWLRDYGANTIYGNDVDTLMLVDWIYNRPRPLDDQVPYALGDAMNLPVFGTTQAPTDLVGTGGNFHTDGMGTAFSSELIVDENSAGNPFGVTAKSMSDIEAIMDDFMGIDRYITMPILPYDGIHHIDMHMRLLDEETLLVGEYPEGIADGPQIEANLQYVLSNFNSAFGTPYKVIRIPMPPHNGAYPNTWWAHYRTYANSVFVNKTMLVPIYEEQYDTVGLRIYREALPGYKVIGIDCNSVIPAGGALHCITREVGVADPLWIVHQAIGDQVDPVSDIPVEATIKHRSGVQAAQVYYTTDTLAGYESVPMSLTDAQSNTWTGYIPRPSGDAEVFYYIGAESNTGKTQVRPMPAPEGYWNFNVSVLTYTSEPAEQLANTRLEQVYPNPARAITCIPVHSDRAAEARIVVSDLFGSVIETVFSGQLPAGASNHFIHAQQYAPGTYLVQLYLENSVQVQKLIVQ